MVTEERLQQLEQTITDKTKSIAITSAVVSGGLSLASIVYTFISTGKKPCSCKLPANSEASKPPEESPSQSARRRSRRVAKTRQRRY